MFDKSASAQACKLTYAPTVRARCAPDARQLLDVLPMQRNIQPLALLLFGHAQADGHIDDLQDDVANDEAINQSRPDAPALGQHATLHPADLFRYKRAGE